MPIKGLTDKVDISFPFIGSIRKGAKKTEANKPGADLTFFRAVFTDEEKDAAAAFFAAHGAEPREINILLPFPEPERNFEAWQEEYTAGALVHRCDGETCVLWRSADGEIHHDPKPCPGGCVPVGRLKVIIPELRRLAFMVVHTTSVWDIQEITRNLAALKALTRNGVSGIPLVLKRRPREISTPWKDGKRARRKKWLLSIEADPKWVDRKLAEMQQLATPGAPELPALPAPEPTPADALPDTDEVTGELLDEGPDWDNVDDEDTDAKQAQPEPEPEPEPAPQPTGRPYSPDKLLERLEVISDALIKKHSVWRTAVIAPGQRDTLNALLADVVRGEGDSSAEVDANRSHLVRDLSDGRDITDLTMAWAGALIEWAKGDPELARQEAHLIVRAQMAPPIDEPAEQ